MFRPKRLLLIAAASFSVYIMLELIPVSLEVLWAVVLSAALLVWKFFVRGFAWKKLLVLIKVLSPTIIGVTLKGIVKFFAKGALKKLFLWLHREYEILRKHVKSVKRVLLRMRKELQVYWQEIAIIDRVLIVIALFPIAVFPLLYIALKKTAQVFLSQKLGEAVAQKATEKTVKHLQIQKEERKSSP